MIPEYLRAGDPPDREYFIDVVNNQPRQPISVLQQSLVRLGFSDLFVQKYAELRWELVDGLSFSVAERMN